MIERNVRLPGGAVADRHRAWYICHDADSEVTTVHVMHYAGEAPVTSIGYEFALDVGLTFDEAEELVAELPEMEEYADDRAALVADMAALLTDEQMAPFAERIKAAGLAQKVAATRIPDAGLQPVRPGKGLETM